MPLTTKSIKKSIFPERTSCFAAADTQFVTEEMVRDAPYFSGSEKFVDTQKIKGVSTPNETKSLPSSNCFDKITIMAGSSGIFFISLILIGVWLILGIVFGATDTWQIMFQNASSIQVYITDILLIRQQQNANQALLTTLAELQSRRETCTRLLAKIPESKYGNSNEKHECMIDSKSFDDNSDEQDYLLIAKPTGIRLSWISICSIVAQALGSIWSFIFYWIGIGIWVAVGPSLGFSNTWQLYINTATALALTFTSIFLQNIQQHQEDKLSRCLEQALKIDAGIELQLRALTGDQKPNPIYTIPAAPRSFIERLIDGFADIMGSGAGVVISLLFTVAWIISGPALKFNDNWWLIIGTFTGLIGFIDGFILRSLYFREESYTKLQFQKLASSDSILLEKLHILYKQEEPRTLGLAERISLSIGNACGHRYASVGSVAVVIILLTVASSMLWSESGQLLCNTPTMIVEGFLLLVLIQAHNHANEERVADFSGLLKRRLLLHGSVLSLT
ncbi:Bgt-1232 [Blumeria graminis f. sp. tritici]|uniref:Bgt-1232 n=3 Tax=Blumeria graminis TaxID=34373 RepID=A0A381L715_BLUGR|nr:Low-affinity Fe(II) transporter [Blumeria graminis f. sp. tritici 96224]VDB83636.1 Bgt-1232 [Blumeria graminis f. sp. tritici]